MFKCVLALERPKPLKCTSKLGAKMLFFCIVVQNERMATKEKNYYFCFLRLRHKQTFLPLQGC